MQVSPCLHPVLAFNKSLGEYIHVPCGKCAACVSSKGFSRKLKGIKDLENFKVKVLVTLTYSDDHLPLAKFDGSEYFVHQKDVDYNGEFKKLHISYLNPEDYEYYYDCVNRFGGLPVLSHRDMILFRKRLRYHFNYEAKKRNFKVGPLYIYTVGEYGPTTFRPHYHLCIGVQSEREFSILEECVCRSWKFVSGSSVTDRNRSGSVSRSIGYYDFQRCVDEGSIGYVTQYLNCVTELPNIYQRSPFRPFAQTSDSMLRSVRESEFPTGEQFLRDLPVQIFAKESGKSGSELIATPSSLEVKFFPKIPKLCKVPECYWYRFYSVYFRFPIKAKQFAQNCLDAFNSGAFLSQDDRFLKWLYYDRNNQQCTFNNLVKLYYASRRVCLNCYSYGLTPYQYCQKMIQYFSRKELFKLKRFYNLIYDLQNDPYSPASLSSLFYLYYDTPNDLKNLSYYYDQFGLNDPKADKSFRVIPKFQNYSFITRKIVSDTTKTKKRNSYFEKRGFTRPSYYPFVNRKFLKFL